MPKGFFTQGAVVLTERALTRDVIEAALRPFKVVKFQPAGGGSGSKWMSGAASWTLAYRPEANGSVTVDVVDAPWPDDMGDPSTETGKDLFVAWSMGFMGPFTFPGNLERAAHFASAFDREKAAEAATRHKAFVRVRSTYISGADDDAPVIPQDYEPLPELKFVTSVARSLVKAPGALAYFNPGGETLLTAADLDEILAECKQSNLPPLPLWTETRMTKADDDPAWVLADVCGMGQLDVDDQEACFRADKCDPGEVLNFLRNIALYLLQNGPVIKGGHTTDGPGGVWRAVETEEAILSPPRPTLRWFPNDGGTPPAEFLKGRKKPAGFFGRLRSLFGKS